jgi:hypothetical protein
MCVGSRKFTLVLLLAAALLLPSVASAQNSSASGDWAALNTVTSGSKLAVKTKDGRSFEGRLSGVTDSALSLSVKDKPVELRREDVQSVYRVGKNSATKATLIGMGVGAGVGALTGYLIGRGGSKRTLIYEAARP